MFRSPLKEKKKLKDELRKREAKKKEGALETRVGLDAVVI